MPSILRVGPHRFFFFSNEGNEPSHIHVETAGSYAKFWLDPVAPVKAVGYNRKRLNELQKLVEANKQYFLEAWHEYFT